MTKKEFLIKILNGGDKPVSFSYDPEPEQGLGGEDYVCDFLKAGERKIYCQYLSVMGLKDFKCSYSNTKNRLPKNYSFDIFITPL